MTTTENFPLIGRADLIALTDAVVTGTGTAPPAILLVGEAGSGKTTVLRHAVRAAGDDLRVLTAAGGAGGSPGHGPLARMLWPVLPFASALPPGLRDAIAGLVEEPAATSPRWSLTRDAVAALLEAAAAERPVLLAVDDVDRFDDDVRDLLLGVTAHLVTTRVRAVLTSRRLDVLRGADRTVRTVELAPLSPQHSAQLVDAQPEQPDPSVRGEIIRWSRGNPLALIEYSRAYARNRTTTFHGATMCDPAGAHPMFADQIAALPQATRTLLAHAAAGTGQETVDMITAAAGFAQDFSGWEPARAARLVEFADDRTVVFAGALLRAAAYAACDFGEQRAAHLALAAMPGLDAGARAWHLGSAAAGPDESIAAALEDTSAQSVGRVSELQRARALQRAAELSPDRADAARRYALAAGAANYAGDVAWALSLADVPLRESDDPDVSGYAALTRASILLQSGRPGDAFTAVGDVLDGDWPGDTQLVLALLYSAAGSSYYSGVWEHRRDLGRWLDRMPDVPATPSRFPLPFPAEAMKLQRAYAAMYAGTAAADSRPAPPDGRWFEPQSPAVEPYRRLVAGVMAFVGEDTAVAARELSVAIERLSAGGGLRGFTFAFAPLSWTLLDTGQWTTLEAVLDEAAALCAVARDATLVRRETLACRARLRAMRGDVDAAARAVLDARDLSATGGGPPGATEVNLEGAAGWIALASGDFDEAYRRFRTMFTADGQPAHFVVSYRAIADVAWAAARSGRVEEVQPLIAAVSRRLGSKPPVRLRLLRHQALALTAETQSAERHHKLAVFDPAGEQWPLERARARLHYGEWLRRARRPAEARPLLAAALDVFERFGAEPLAAIARSELRAAGVTTVAPGPVDDALLALTAQERQIVVLAASGQTNREIAERLKLSPRTVASHLYHVYPKLGVSRRHELRAFTS
ncbi:helix-turn-helix transcriptional regulator [Mycolicibacterium arseniciresistens]|uniref:LuxR C-terminal-related transcriptional regulator n=1 Tax=Mycolicibacterium arseniciresistens TaxID=3062257 RepID=A0ABT8UCP5_9MYCO|nr:LuxR family transcriptional regulator [Mycolicibacterium arseniciresistens]MDO3635559.1 LuxR C-terminal-related transcriptional regulator [Mycolicibacterium arseniciresistens]